MLRTGHLPPPPWGVVAPLRRRDFAQRREPRYQGPWRLPGPDFHRLAALNLSPGYVMTISFDVLAPELLDAHFDLKKLAVTRRG
jgi:hypothetical protein